MAKQPTTGQKKSKADIAKAAAQKKGGRKVLTIRYQRNGPRERSRRRLTTPSSSTRLATIKSWESYRAWASSSRFPPLWTGSRSAGKHTRLFSSIARRLVRDLSANGQLKYLEQHSRQVLAVSTAPPKKAEETKAAETKEVKKAGKKASKQ